MPRIKRPTVVKNKRNPCDEIKANKDREGQSSGR